MIKQYIDELKKEAVRRHLENNISVGYIDELLKNNIASIEREVAIDNGKLIYYKIVLDNGYLYYVYIG